MCNVQLESNSRAVGEMSPNVVAMWNTIMNDKHENACETVIAINICPRIHICIPLSGVVQIQFISHPKYV